jgi:hypothetical protein
LVARLDSDDRAASNRLALQVLAFEDRPNLGLVGGRSRVIDADGNLVRSGEETFVPLSFTATRWASVFFNPFRHSAVTFRKAIVLDELGGYPEDAKDLEDYALWTTLMKDYEAINLPNIVCDYRVHDTSIIATAKRAGCSMVDPRRVAASKYYGINAMYFGVPNELAEIWGGAWASLRFPFKGESINTGELRHVFNQIIAYAPCQKGAVKQEGSEVSAHVFSLLINFYRGRFGNVASSVVVLDAFRRFPRHVLRKIVASSMARIRRNR